MNLLLDCFTFLGKDAVDMFEDKRNKCQCIFPIKLFILFYFFTSDKHVNTMMNIDILFTECQ